jgi:hypothetical protein
VKRPELVTQGLLLVLIAAVCWMGYQVGHLSSAVVALAARSVDPAPPAVKPIDPAPKPEVKPDPAPNGEIEDPRPRPTPPPADTPLSRAMRDYLRQAPVTLPDTLDAMADRLDNRELADKASAVTFFKKPAAAMNAALDQVFSPGLDKEGKVADPGKISGPLRDSARALRGVK